MLNFGLNGVDENGQGDDQNFQIELVEYDDLTSQATISFDVSQLVQQT